MATSELDWSISAPVTPVVVPDGQVYRYTITASAEPYIRRTETRSGIGVVAIDTDGGAAIVKQATSGQPKVWTYYYKLAALAGQRFPRVQ